MNAAPTKTVAAIVVLALVVLVGAYTTLLAPPAGVSLPERSSIEGVSAIADWLAGEDRGHKATENAWQRRDALPPFTGMLQALGAWSLASTIGEWRAVATVNLLAGLLSLALVFWMLFRRLSMTAAVVGALLLALSPGFVEQMQGVGPEALFGLGLVLLVGAVFLAERGATGMMLAALAFALLMGLHASGVVMWLPLLAYVAVRRPAAAPSTERGGIAVAPLPLYPFAGIVLGLVLLVSLWPWLSIQTPKRLAEYLFNVYTGNHPDFLWLGDLYVQSKSSAPPFWAGVMLTVGRLSVPLVVLSVVGLGATLRTARRRDEENPGAADLLLPALMAVTLVAVFTLSGTPFHDGNDGLRAALPLLALLGGAGAHACLQALARAGVARRVTWPAFAALVLLFALLARAEAGDAGRSFYNGFAGGRGGVARLATQLRPSTGLDGPVLRWLHDELPAGGAVAFAPASRELGDLARAVQRAEGLPEYLTIGELSNARFLVVPFLPAEPGYDETNALIAPYQPVATFARNGVPLARVYDLAPDAKRR